MTLPSGVICGFTLSARLALRNDTAVAPEEVACWYGISVPCSISASTWSAVSTRGLEMILPLPSASSAESSRLRKRVSGAVEQDERELPGGEGVQAGRRQVDDRSTSVGNAGAVAACCPVWNPVSSRLPPTMKRGLFCPSDAVAAPA